MKNYLIVVFVVFVCLVINKAVYAERQEIIAEGEYIMGEGETMEVAGEKARRNAIRAAAEQAGTFVRSYSKVQNLELKEDIIEVVANHAMKVSVIDEQTELVGKKSLRIRMKIKAALTTEEVEANIRKAKSDLALVESYKKLQADYARLARETEELKKRLPNAAGEERKNVLARIGSEEARFRANVLYEKGARLNEELKFDEADEALTQSIALNPDFAMAYVLRAIARAVRAVEKIEPALADIEKAVALEPGNAKIYMIRADILRRNWTMNGCNRSVRTTCEKVLADMDKAISLDPGNALYHVSKGDLLAEIERFDEAIREMDVAMKMGDGNLPSNIGVLLAYMMKARIMRDKGDLKGSLAELDKVVKISESANFITSEDNRVLDVLRAFFREQEGRNKSAMPDVSDGRAADRERATIAEKFGIPADKIDAEMPRITDKIQKSMMKLEFIISAYENRAGVRLEYQDYRGGRSDMRKACGWAKKRPDPSDRIALCDSADFERDLDNQFSPAGRWLRIGKKAFEEWQSGADARRDKPETYTEAMEAYGKAITLNPRFAEAYEARCRLRFFGGMKERNEKLITDCSEALRYKPKLFDARMTRADVYRDSGEKEKALNDYSKLVEFYPDAGGARHQRIGLLRQLGRFDQALAETDEMIRKHPEDNQWFYVKAETCEEAGRLLDALHAWEAYVKIWEKLDRKMRNPGENELDQLRQGKAKVQELRAKLNSK